MKLGRAQVNPTLGRKRSDGFSKRVQRGMRERIAKGERFGRNRRIHPTVHAICEICGVEFLWTEGTSHGDVKHRGGDRDHAGRVCSKRCWMTWLHRYRQILPAVETIKRLYWDEGLSLWDIARRFGVTDAKTVRQAMEKGGIRRRPKGNFGKKICIAKDCDEPTFKIPHKGNGSDYGRRCEKHWKEHRKGLQLDYQKRRHNSPMLGIIDAMLAGETTSHGIAHKLDVPVKRVSCTMSHLRRFGVIEILGRYRYPRPDKPGKTSGAQVYGLTDEWKTKMPTYLTNLN